MSESYLDENSPHFLLAVADFNIRVNCNHAKLAKIMGERYRDFPAKKTPNFTANIQWVGQERASSLLDTNTDFQESVLQFSAPGYQGFINEKTNQGELRLSSAQPVEDIDYYLRVVLALLAHSVDGILMHTAGIIRDGLTHLFFGQSGSGKTTACRVSADDYTILNDDLILLLPKEDGWIAHGTPFWNPTQVKPSNQSAPVVGMYLLIQAPQVALQKLHPGHAAAALISNVPVIPQDFSRSHKLFEILAMLQENIPVFELHFLPDNTFWDVIPN